MLRNQLQLPTDPATSFYHTFFRISTVHHPSIRALKCLSLYFHWASLPPSRSGRHSNGWFRKGGRVSQSSCCSAPCGAFTGYFCFCAAFMALTCWRFRWLSHKLINYTTVVCSLPLKDTLRVKIYSFFICVLLKFALAWFFSSLDRQIVLISASTKVPNHRFNLNLLCVFRDYTEVINNVICHDQGI